MRGLVDMKSPMAEIGIEHMLADRVAELLSCKSSSSKGDFSSAYGTFISAIPASWLRVSISVCVGTASAPAFDDKMRSLPMARRPG